MATAVRTSRCGRSPIVSATSGRVGLGRLGTGGGVAANLLHLLAQPHHPRRIQKQRRRLGLRIVFAGDRRVRLQAGDLRIRPVRLAHPGPPILGPQANLARIQVDRHDLRGLPIDRLEFSRLHLLDLVDPAGPPARDPAVR